MSRRPQTGFTYLALLFFIALIGVGLGSIGLLWHRAQQAEKEQELLFIGNEFRTAIKAYYYGISGVNMYPAQLSDLLKDPRQLTPRRYLRKIYLDPMTLKTQWGLVQTPEGHIMGVYSLSADAPQKKANFSANDRAFMGAQSYADWKFVFLPEGSAMGR